MMNSPELVIIISLVIIAVSIYKAYEGFSSEIIYVKSTVDNHRYLVRNLSDKVNAANMLAMLRQKLKTFVAHLAKDIKNDVRVERLNVRFKPNNITESTSNSKYTSYTVNKGSKIIFCIRERDQNNMLVDMNTLIFVALHELAHVMTVSLGHTKEFWNNFKFLLKFATDNNYYTYHPYHHTPKKYCGVMITDTPLKT